MLFAAYELIYRITVCSWTSSCISLSVIWVLTVNSQNVKKKKVKGEWQRVIFQLVAHCCNLCHRLSVYQIHSSLFRYHSAELKQKGYKESCFVETQMLFIRMYFFFFFCGSDIRPVAWERFYSFFYIKCEKKKNF